MFANPKFNARRAPSFHNSFVYDNEVDPRSIPYIKPCITNDNDVPSKTLISIDIFDIPHDAEGALKDKYDYITGVALLPEDAIKFVRYLNALISAVFDDMNYVKREAVKSKAVKGKAVKSKK